MNNRPLPQCPWCGKVMNKYITEFSDGKFGGHYGCGAMTCGTSAPFVEAESWDECAELAYKAAMRRTMQKPIQPSEIFQQSYQVPCWLERRGEIRISPEVLDRDSAGWFGKIESRIWIDYKKMKPEDYGKTWRCWRTRPTNEEIEATAWEE